jgi:hypothetical protein
VDAYECKVNPDNFDPEGLKVFRSQYPKGRNFVTGPWIDIPYDYRYGDLSVTCGTPAGARQDCEMRSRRGPGGRR